VTNTFGVHDFAQWVDFHYVCADAYSIGSLIKQAAPYLKGKAVSDSTVSLFD